MPLCQHGLLYLHQLHMKRNSETRREQPIPFSFLSSICTGCKQKYLTLNIYVYMDLAVKGTDLIKSAQEIQANDFRDELRVCFQHFLGPIVLQALK